MDGLVPSICGNYVASCTRSGAYTLVGQAIEVDVHELSVCQALLTQVGDISRQHDNAVIERITIEMGPLSGVDSQLLRNAYQVMRVGSTASHADLVVNEIEVRIECLICARAGAASSNRLVCGACGSFRTRIIAGNELRLMRVEMRAASLSASPSHFN
jgi:hydrogenase nickel incorporation protein HypA/HybF